MMVGFYAFFALIALSLVLAVKSESSSIDVAAWNKSYDGVFGAMRLGSDEKDVARQMILMHSGMKLVEDAIDQEKKDNFKFWYDAMSVTNTDNCHVSHIDALYNKLDIPSNKDKPNLVKLFRVVHKNLVGICSNTVSSLVDEIEEQLEEGNGEKGPCTGLLNLVRKPNMKPFYEFAKMLWYNGFGQEGWCPYKTNLYSAAIMACEEIESKYPAFLDQYKIPLKQLGQA